ncbi:hypothetical protein WMY93_009862 [Mugilogobius chulae]|uniref:Uncharacterized protein n=1 Tax=Mugilogobius chulae TaxID=88201 RepID=A0AAW0P5X1_9GOBI
MKKWSMRQEGPAQDVQKRRSKGGGPVEQREEQEGFTYFTEEEEQEQEVKKQRLIEGGPKRRSQRRNVSSRRARKGETCRRGEGTGGAEVPEQEGLEQESQSRRTGIGEPKQNIQSKEVQDRNMRGRRVREGNLEEDV